MYLKKSLQMPCDSSRSLSRCVYSQFPVAWLICVCLSGVMGEYEPKIEVQVPEVVHVAKGSTVKLECFALGK